MLRYYGLRLSRAYLASLDILPLGLLVQVADRTRVLRFDLPKAVASLN